MQKTNILCLLYHPHTGVCFLFAPFCWNTAAALGACLECIGGLPLVGVAQLAAFVLQLVGRCFLDLPDLCPDTFKVHAGRLGGRVAKW